MSPLKFPLLCPEELLFPHLIRRRQLPKLFRHIQHGSFLVVTFGPHVGLHTTGRCAVGPDGGPLTLERAAQVCENVAAGLA